MSLGNTSYQAFLNYFEKEFLSFIRQNYGGASRLHEAATYALSGKGKRVRPLLVFFVNQALGGKQEQALAPAIALEMIHTYSLVHDDMPVMDDDDYRRGRKTVHVVFDEATALLTGNALLTDAFMLLSSDNENLNAKQRCLMISSLASCVGSSGMLHGQMLDVFWTKKQDYTEKNLEEIHLNKTGKLLGAACALGALSVPSTSRKIVETYRRVGELIGLSFQIIDDLLDTSSQTGKTAGKDFEQGKLTYLSLYPREKCLEKSSALTREAFALLRSTGSSAKLEDLESYFSLLLERKK